MIERYRTPFGQRLFDARTAAGLKQTEVCRRLQISQGTLSELERSAHSSGHVAALAALYHVDAHYLAEGVLSVREPHSKGQGAHTPGHHPGTMIHRYHWGELMSSTAALPEIFKVEMPDASMAPRIRRGDVVTFSTGETPRPGDGVLVRDTDGTMYIRMFRERRGGTWEAHAVNDAYQALDSVRDGLVVLAVLIGVQQRWSDQ